MKKSICLAIVGAAVLTGCQNEVMQQREYVPAPREDAEAVSTAVPGENAVNDRSAGSTEIADERGGAAAERPADRPAGKEQEFPTMSGSFNNEGVSGDGGAPSARGGEYVVRPGDTLGKIAAAHHVSLSALMKANNLTNKDAKRLRVGRKLVIPSGREAAASGRGKGKVKGKKGSFGGGEAATGKSAKKSAKAELQPGEYVIKSGDTPEKIARRAGVKLSALMEANKMTEEAARRLQVGQKIVIPGKAGATTTAAAPKPRQQTAAQPAAKTPTAGSDDIENQMNDATVKPETAAPATTPAATPATPAATQVTPGQNTATPAVPVPDADSTSYVQVKEDISIDAFARQHGTTPEVIRQLNPDITGNQLTKGRICEVPKK